MHSRCERSDERLREATGPAAQGREAWQPCGRGQGTWPGRHPRHRARREVHCGRRSGPSAHAACTSRLEGTSSAASSRCETKRSSRFSSVAPVAEPWANRAPTIVVIEPARRLVIAIAPRHLLYRSSPHTTPQRGPSFKNLENQRIDPFRAAKPCGRTRFGTGRMVADEEASVGVRSPRPESACPPHRGHLRAGDRACSTSTSAKGSPSVGSN